MRKYLYIFAFFILYIFSSAHAMNNQQPDILDTIMNISGQPCAKFPGAESYCQDIYNDLHPEAQATVLTYLNNNNITWLSNHIRCSNITENTPYNEMMKILPNETEERIMSYVFNDARISTIFSALPRKIAFQSLDKCLLQQQETSGDLRALFVLRNIKHIFEAKKEHLLVENENVVPYHETFIKIPKKKQCAILDYLYEQKYDPCKSPLWKDVKTVSDEKDYKKRDLTVICKKIDTWSTQDPAAWLYASLINNDPTKNKFFEPGSFSSCHHLNQGLDVRVYSGWHGEDHSSRLITKTAYGKTEMPLILALSHWKWNAPDRIDGGRENWTQTVLKFNNDTLITSLHDVDIEALKTAHEKSIYIRFAHISQDAYISPHIAKLNNTKIEMDIIPDSLNNIPELQHCSKKYINEYGYPTQCLYTISNAYDYWHLKALAKIGLFCGFWYLTATYIMREGLKTRNMYTQLENQARVNTFTTEIRPLLTPETTDALHVLATTHDLPDLLANVGTLQHAVSVSPSSLAAAQLVISKTNTIQNSSYHVDTTSFSSFSQLSYYLTKFCLVPIGLAQTVMAIGYNIFYHKGTVSEKRSILREIAYAPCYLIDSIYALKASLFNPKDMLKHIDTNLKIYATED